MKARIIPEGTELLGGLSGISYRKGSGKTYLLLLEGGTTYRQDLEVGLRALPILLKASPDSRELLFSLFFDPSVFCFFFLAIQHLTFSLPSRLKSPHLLFP